MKKKLKLYLFPIVVGMVMSIGAQEVQSKETLVFVSAMAAGEEGAIHAYQLEVVTGRMSLAERTTDVDLPFFLALSPDRKFLYSIHAPEGFGGKSHEQIAAYSIVGSAGQLKLLNRQSALGAAACYLDVDATGKTVVVANYSTGSVASFPVREDGSLGKAASFVEHTGSSVVSSRQAEPHAHCFVISPDNRFAYVADLGLDQVLGYRLDVEAGKLSPNRQPFVRTPPGAGPRHLTFHPKGNHVYVINELSNSVTGFDYDDKSGILIEKQTISTLPKDFDGKSYCADLKITPNGRFLYGTNRGHDSIAAYRIDEEGRLALLNIVPSRGKSPQNLAITPGGELLLCANMSGNNVVLFKINPQSGELAQIGEPIAIPSPSCIMIR